MNDTINESLQNNFYNNPEISRLLDNYKKQIFDDSVNPYEVAQLLLDSYFKKG